MSFRPIRALILREIATTHGRSFGGYAWMIIEPVAAVTILSVVFSLFFASPPLGSSFPLFYASGYLLFGIYNDVAQKTAQALRYSRPLLAYPVVNWLDAVLARFFLAMMTHAAVCVVVLVGVALIEDVPLRFDIGVVAAGVVLGGMLGLGVGMTNMILFEMIPVWERVWAILNRPLFLVSGVLFLPDHVPEPFRSWLELNPLTHIISLAREGLYASYHADIQAVGMVLAGAMVLMLFALIILGKHARGRLLDG